MIDEKKLVEEIEKLPFIHDRYDKKNANPHFISGVESMYEMIMNLINSQPKVGEWIPVSERLPEKEAREYMRNDLSGIGRLYPCLLTYQNPNTKRIIVEEFYYYIDEQCFVTQAGRPCEKEHCLVWMPLPEPWKGKE